MFNLILSCKYVSEYKNKGKNFFKRLANVTV